jgi:hypothetical protein
MNRILAVFLVSTLLISFEITLNPVAEAKIITFVKLTPSLIEYHEDASDQQFTASVIIENVTDLYGFDIRFRWNTTFLTYVSHSVRVPRDNYPDGILQAPTFSLTNAVNATAGTYRLACSSMAPASPFDGTGTAFNITFRVRYHPPLPAPTTNTLLELYQTDLADSSGNRVLHDRRNGTVTFYALSERHDVAVLSINPSKTVVGQGYATNLSIEVLNRGSYTETFNVTANANSAAIQIQAVTLTYGSSAMLIFTWNTADFGKGNYTVNAYAAPVLYETDTADNNFTDGRVSVTIPGDVDGDFDVDLYDATRLFGCYGLSMGKAGFIAECDIDNSGQVFLFDAVILLGHYGQKYP